MARRTRHAVELAPVAARAEEVAGDDARVERAVLGVDGGDLLHEGAELGERRANREAGVSGQGGRLHLERLGLLRSHGRWKG